MQQSVPTMTGSPGSQAALAVVPTPQCSQREGRLSLL